MTNETPPQMAVTIEQAAECHKCSHYGNHGGRGGGTPPWSVCLFRMHPSTCGRFNKRAPYSWEKWT
jgi:hypothetical protein